MASRPSVLRRGVLWCVLFLTLSALLIGAVLALVMSGRWPVSSLPVTVLLLGLCGTVLGLVFTFSLTGPALSRRRELALARVLADVTAGKYRPAPDEVWLFKRRSWWTHTRELTPLGQAVLDRRHGEERRVRTQAEHPLLLQTQRRRAGVLGAHVTVVDTSTDLESGGHSPVRGRA